MTISANPQKPDTARRPAARRAVSGWALLGLACLLAALTWLRALAQGRSGSADTEVDPYILKGYFVMALASAVKWPEKLSEGPFRIVLIRCGNAQQERDLKKAIAAYKSPLKPEIVTESLQTSAGRSNLASAHVLFLGTLVGAKDALAIQRDLASRPILTVIDEKVPLLRQGYIGAVLQKGDKVIVSLSRTNLQKAGLSLDVKAVAPLVESKLLELNE